MISFFRRLRLGFLSYNRITKYSIYAVGEIILVVIGILIALQINNWNERNKKDSLELDILDEVRIGLKSDLKDATFNLQSQQSKLRSQNIIINWLETNQPFHDSLSLHINIIHYGTYFQSNESPYQTLKQIGLRTIKNDSLRNQITNLYDLDYEQYNKYNEEYEALSDNLLSESASYFNELDFYGSNMEPINTSGLRLNNRFLFYLKTMRNYNEVLVNQTVPNIIQNIMTTSKMIDHEIETRS